MPNKLVIAKSSSESVMHASPMQELDGFVLGDSQGKKFRIWGKSRSSSFALGSKRQDATSPQIMLPPVQCLLKRFTAQSLHSAVRHGGKYQKGLKKKTQLITFHGLLAPTPASVKHRGGPWCCGAASHWYLVSQLLTELSKELAASHMRSRLEGCSQRQTTITVTKVTTGPQEKKPIEDNKISDPSNEDHKVSSQCDKINVPV